MKAVLSEGSARQRRLELKAQLTSMAAQKLASNLLWPVTSFCSAYARAAERRPFVVGVLTTGIKTSCADLFAQKVSTPFCAKVPCLISGL